MKKIMIGITAAALIVGGTACKASTTTHTVPAPRTPAVATAAPVKPAVEPQTYEGAKAAIDKLETSPPNIQWMMLTKIGQETMTEADYVKVGENCKALFANEKVISFTLNDAMTVATVTEASPDGLYEWTLVYEYGHWKHQPSPEAMAWMSLSADKALAELESAGAC